MGWRELGSASTRSAVHRSLLLVMQAASSRELLHGPTGSAWENQDQSGS